MRAERIGDGTWERFFLHRREEMESAYSLVQTLRDIDHVVFERLKGGEVSAVDATAE